MSNPFLVEGSRASAASAVAHIAIGQRKHSGSLATGAIAAEVARCLSTGETVHCAVGHVGFMLRASDGGGRMLTQAEVAALGDVAAGASEPAIRGTISLAGPPGHSMGEVLFTDLPSAAGAIWRALASIPEPGMCIDVVLENGARVLTFEHAERALSVTVVDDAGQMLSRRLYDPFALLEGVTTACERFERLLRTRGLTNASNALHRQYARPAFPRIVPETHDLI